MKKKFSKILGVGLALMLLVSLGAFPVAADPNTVTVTADPDGTAVDPVTGDFTITVEYDGALTPDFMYLTMGVPTMYGHSPRVLGQDKEEMVGSITIKLVADEADPTNHLTWNTLPGNIPAPGLDDQFGFVGATYDADDMEWTITFNTQKKCGVGDNWLLGAGWWPGQEVWFDGVYIPIIEVYFTDGDPEDNSTDGDLTTSDGGQTEYIFDNPVHIQPELGLNAKGAQQKFWLNWIDMVRVEVATDVWESKPIGHKNGDGQGGWVWVLDPGVNLTTWGDPISPYDIKVLAGGRPYRDSGGAWHPAEMITNPLTGPDIPFPDRFIEVVARAPILGDAEFEVWTAVLEDNPDDTDAGTPVEYNEEVASAEKKWGELNYSKLDVHIDFEFEDGLPAWSDIKAAVEADLADWVADDHETWVNAGECVEGGNMTAEPNVFTQFRECAVYELVAEKVWASFLQLEDPLPAGGALVHWWLAKDTEANQEWIQLMMSDIVDRAGDLGFRGHDPDEVDSNEDWSATGDYAPSPADHPADIIMDWIDPPGTLDDKFATDTDLIQFVPDIALDPYLEKDIPMGDTPYINPDKWYGRSVTMDSHLGEIPGVTIAMIENVDAEDVLIITLVEYQQDYNGENLILIQIGKKHFGVPPPPAQVKTTQLRWAGEKIVLEKDWGVAPSNPDGSLYIAIYWLEEGSIGNLEAIIAFPDGDLGINLGAQQVITLLDEGISRVILSTEQQGQADVNAALYMIDIEKLLISGPIDNHGFLVYFMAFEDVVLAEGVPLDLVPQAGEQIDVTPLAGLQNLDPAVDAADVAVQVRGWFTSDALPGTTRTPVDVDGDGLYDLPAGRYVMPNDWPGLAGYNYELRPNWDIMDEAHLDGIVSDFELGPYDGAVASAGPLGEAEEPNIGPFTSLQQWSVDDLWIAEATSVPTSHPLYTFRNTVVPDGFLDWLDAPMPQALVIFDIVAWNTIAELPALSGLDKGVLEGYGVENGPQVDLKGLVADVFQSPFYMVEIAAHWAIPGGYNWDSWGTAGPYDYWFDIGIDSIIADTPEDPVNDQDVEVYSDNHGIAAVTIDALMQTGSVTITATAEFPYAPKKGKHAPRTSDEITAVWGPPDLNPHFLADKPEPQEVEVGEDVTFTNETTGGTLPYVLAEWDLDGDGTPEIILDTTGVDDPLTPWDDTAPMATVVWAYDAPNPDGYSVILTMTDTAAITRWEERPNYILVIGEVVEFDPWIYDVDGSGFIEKDEAVAALIDYLVLGIRTKENAVEVLILYLGI